MISPQRPACPFFRRIWVGHPLDLYRQADVSGDVSADTRLPSDLTRSAEKRRMSICSPFVQWIGWKRTRCPFSADLPIGGQQSSDRSVPARWAGMDLPTACSVGIKGAIPRWADPPRVKGALFLGKVWWSKPYTLRIYTTTGRLHFLEKIGTFWPTAGNTW